MNKSRGFTLIELLVVIAIIGLLATVVIASLATSRIKANDAKIKQEVAEFAKLLELQHLKTGTYVWLQRGDTSTVGTCDTAYAASDFATEAASICRTIVETQTASGGGAYMRTSVAQGTPPAFPYEKYYSIMVYLRGASLASGVPTYYCLGASGSKYEGPAQVGGVQWAGKGCHANP